MANAKKEMTVAKVSAFANGALASMERIHAMQKTTIAGMLGKILAYVLIAGLFLIGTFAVIAGVMAVWHALF